MTLLPSIGKGGRLAKRLTLITLLASALIATLITALQLYLEYDYEVSEIHERFNEIKTTHLPSIQQGLWVLDSQGLQTLIDGIRRLPDFEYVAIRSNEQIIAKSGTIPTKGGIVRHFEIDYTYRNSTRHIGVLEVVASNAEAIERTWHRLEILLLLNGIKTIVVALLILQLVRRMITEPLARICTQSRQMAEGNLAAPLTLAENLLSRSDDEVHELAESLDRMRIEIRQRTEQLQDSKQALKDQYIELLKSEEEVRASESNFRDSITFIPVPIGIAMNDGSIVFLNQAFTAAYGYELKDLNTIADWSISAYPEKTYRDTVMQTWANDVAKALSLGTSTPCREYRVVCKNGEIRRVLITMRPISNLFISIFEDITERKSIEEELVLHRDQLERLVLERTQELNKNNAVLEQTLSQLRLAQNQLIQASKLASLGELVAGVAHELNTPIGNARTVCTNLCEQSAEFQQRLTNPALGLKKVELHDFLQHIETGNRLLDNNLSRAANLIHSFKQVAVDRTSSQRRTFDLREVTEEVVATLVPFLKKFPFKVEIEIDTGIRIDGYPGAYSQVIVNLIENALKHGLEGRSSGTVLLTGKRQNDVVEITVSDNGEGIPKENIARIFDPFFTTKLGQGGSGLGLNIVFNIVTGLLGGQVEVNSVIGEGTCFKILIPHIAPSFSKNTEA